MTENEGRQANTLLERKRLSLAVQNLLPEQRKVYFQALSQERERLQRKSPQKGPVNVSFERRWQILAAVKEGEITREDFTAPAKEVKQSKWQRSEFTHAGHSARAMEEAEERVEEAIRRAMGLPTDED